MQKRKSFKKLKNCYNVFVTTKGHKRNYEWFNVKGNTLPYINRDPILKMAYDNFLAWLDENGLTVIPVYNHDGMGMQSWTNFSIQPKD